MGRRMRRRGIHLPTRVSLSLFLPMRVFWRQVISVRVCGNGVSALACLHTRQRRRKIANQDTMLMWELEQQVILRGILATQQGLKLRDLRKHTSWSMHMLLRQQRRILGMLSLSLAASYTTGGEAEGLEEDGVSLTCAINLLMLSKFETVQTSFSVILLYGCVNKFHDFIWDLCICCRFNSE